MYTLDGPGGAAEDRDLKDVVPEGEVNSNAAVWAGEIVQGMWGQPSGHEPGMKSVVCEGDGHEMKDRTHCGACMVLVQSDGFPSSAFSSDCSPLCTWRLTAHSACVCPYST